MSVWNDAFNAALCGYSTHCNVPRHAIDYAKECANLAEDIHIKHTNRRLKKVRESLRNDYPEDVV